MKTKRKTVNTPLSKPNPHSGYRVLNPLDYHALINLPIALKEAIKQDDESLIKQHFSSLTSLCNRLQAQDPNQQKGL